MECLPAQEQSVVVADGRARAARQAGPRLLRRTVLRRLGAAGAASAAVPSLWLLGGCAPGQGSGAARPAALPAKITLVSDAPAADYTRYWQQFAAWFEAEHAGTKVEVILPPGQGAYQTKLLALLAGGTVPDLFHLNNQFIYDYHAKGLLQPVDALLRRTAFPMADLIPGTLTPYRVGWDLMGIPRDNATSAIYYNRDLFVAAGLREPATNWTWDDYRSAAQRLSAPERQRFGSTFPQIESTTPAQHLSILRSFGGDWFDAALRQVLIDSPKSREAFTFIANLRLRDRVVGRPEELAPGDQFLSQNAALAHQSQSYLRTVRQANPSFTWDVAPLPRGPAGRVNVVGTTGNCIPREAPDPEAGARLLTFLMGERVQKDMMSEGRWTTPRKSLISFAIPQDGRPSRFKEAIADQLLVSQGVVMPAGFTEMGESFQQEMRPVWVGQRAMTEALAAVKAQWSRLLAERNPPAR